MQRLTIAVLASPLYEGPEDFRAACEVYIPGGCTGGLRLRSEDGTPYPTFQAAKEASERFRDYLGANPQALAARAITVEVVQ